MTEERTTLLRERMLEDMRIRGLATKPSRRIFGDQGFRGFLKRSPDRRHPTTCAPTNCT